MVMIISRTPYRISFFGGGTDYPGWYLKHGGSVLSTTINKYCYISCRYLPPFFEHRIRVVYAKIESCKSVDEIVHPSIRECLKFLNFDRGLEIHHDGDLPARSGMGSSSAFTIGFLHALYALKGCMPGKQQLAEESIHIEQDLIKETVGSQDQVSAAFGGLNHITFDSTGGIHVRPVTVPPDRINELDNHLMLFYTGIKRTAADVAQSYVNDIDCKRRQLRIMGDMVDEGISVLAGNNHIRDFGELLHEAWQAKRSLSSSVSNPEVDELYARARSAGAIGGKLTGAGGGGFLLLFAPPEAHVEIRNQLHDLIHVPFRFDFSGSQIIFVDRQEDYSSLELTRCDQQLKAFRELSEAVK
jgi:D-glycero-alpha-D-manno-heptose-7-phosphate kinase